MLLGLSTFLFAVVSYDYYWDPDPRDTVDMTRMEQLAQRALQKAEEYHNDGFLHLRYAYQAARMYHYSGGPDPFWLYSQQNRYFKELHAEYGDTDFITTAAAECTFLADFISPDIF